MTETRRNKKRQKKKTKENRNTHTNIYNPCLISLYTQYTFNNDDTIIQTPTEDKKTDKRKIDTD